MVGKQTNGKDDADKAAAQPKKRIMVIDDTKPIRILFLKTFEKKYEIWLEERGREALVTYKELDQEIDLLIVDYDMPELNGYQVIRLFRRLSKDLPVIVVSGRLMEYRIEKLRKLGVTEFLAKPVSLNLLRDAINELIES